MQWVIMRLFSRYSQFQEEYTLEQIMNSPRIFGPLTKLQCCPTSDGSAAAILATEDFVHAHGLEKQAVEIVGMEMVTDFPSTFNDRSCMKIVSPNVHILEFIFCKISDILFAFEIFTREIVNIRRLVVQCT